MGEEMENIDTREGNRENKIGFLCCKWEIEQEYERWHIRKE